jgi:hypothetical protein
MNTFARIKNSAVAEYPVYQCHIDARKHPQKWYYPVSFAVKPIKKVTQKHVEQLTIDNGQVLATYAVEDMNSAELAKEIERMREEKLQTVATARRKALDDGFMHNGILWDSDANARIAYAELAMRYQYDPAFVTTWKASDGYWVEMTAPLFQAVYAAGAEHVQTCFAWQAAKEVEIKACQTVDELEAVVVTI